MDTEEKVNSHSGVVYRYVLLADGEEHGWSYVGKTTQEKTRRQNWNKANGKGYGGKKIEDARQKYGVGADVWRYEVLVTIVTNTEEELNSRLGWRETYYIKKYDSVEQGFNTSYGDGNKGVVYTQERRDQIGASSKGRHHTPETKQHLSEVLKDRPVPEETRQKISASKKGQKFTPKHCAAISRSKKGTIMSPEARAKSSATKKGKPHYISPEGMANINAHRFKIAIVVTDDTGNVSVFDSEVEAATYLKVTSAAISSALKKSGYMPSRKSWVAKKQMETV